MEKLIDRSLLASVKHGLQHTAAVALLGPRQCGKTTLAHQILKDEPSIYLDLEAPEDQFKLSDPASFFSQHSDKLIILDEIQNAPHLFAVLRGIIDKNRRHGRRNNQFLLLGSASLDLLKQSSESLAGRINYIEMTGLNFLELGDRSLSTRNRLWLRGGFPESYLAPSDGISMKWLENLIRSYLLRDIPQFAFNIPVDRLRRLWTMLAHCQGETINVSKFAQNLGVSDKTVAHYIDILVDLFLMKRLNPWHVNVKKRITKSPRFYVRDSGVTHRLLGINTYDDLLSHPVLGKSWEAFVIENILSVLPPHVEPYFYRTTTGSEIDLLLHLSGKDLWAIEIKNSTAPKIKKGFHQACEDVKATRKFVLYGGEEDFSLDEATLATSLPSFMSLVKNHP